MSGGRATGTTEWLEFVRQEYPLAEVTFVRDLGGNFNLNLQVFTDQGALVVRISPQWVEADRLAAVQAVRQYLRDRGWPIPRTLRSRSGRTLAQLDGRVVEVEQYVEPSGTSMTTWPAISAGIQWLARLHEDLRAAPTSTAAAHPPMANHIEADAEFSSTIADIRSWSLSAEEATYVDAAEQLAASLAHESPDCDLPRQLVHGDFWATNVYLSGDQLTLLLDLDFLGERPRVDDLALTLFFINDHLGRSDTSSIRIAKLRNLVNDYDAALKTPLSPTERAAIPYAVVRTPLTFLRDLAYLGPSSGPELTTLRGPQYEWALRLLSNPEWRTAFS
ncbi:Ser/Thr protein kinase RdoA (MazF antagonist) [Kribbella sp. VKM Ac-2527]|uniref:Ser/Thr protein kinase RdoA (MazF antagonist) n=1 Tax=Kribbella caucasensis TaxID=2512215 RepID=A0A4R6KHV9_9ACTN|nr:phosphotransferase [Kribbella sp. VKM Ac-2527]TDO49822.1 Ser/Thr protein kinase RdoA (MazF antagonist) [Kribbella sp. VKM Ac-2527]